MLSTYSNMIANSSITLACIALTALAGVRLSDRFSAPAAATLGASEMNAAFSMPTAQLLGDASSKIALVEFSDYECPFCAQFASTTFDQLKKEFVDSGRIRYAVINLPLPIHSLARKASEAAECAGEQGKFWEMRRLLFDNPKALMPTDLERYAGSTQLDLPRFRDCAERGMVSKVQSHLDLAAKLEIKNTPTFVVGIARTDGQIQAVTRIVGAQPIETFRTALKELN